MPSLTVFCACYLNVLTIVFVINNGIILVCRLTVLIGIALLSLGASLSTHAKTLTLLSDDAPPHMIAKTDSGIDIDITREVLKSLGHSVDVEYTPLTRNMVEVAQKRADIFLPTFFQSDSESLYFSDAIIKYRPTVFTLAANKFSFAKISELAGKNIFTFQGATGYFGEEFKQVAATSRYRELPNMAILPALLVAKRCEVVVLDYYIFYYFLRQFADSEEHYHQLASTIEKHELIPQVNAHVGFNDKKLRDDFNLALKGYLAEHKEQKVIESYIGILNAKL